MEVPLTPLEFARRARRLYADREAVVDDPVRLTYAEFFGRCDRWSEVLLRLGVRRGDRVAYIAPNGRQQLESFYAVPQVGAVLVPINFRLSPADFAYIVNHSGASILCVHPDHVAAVESVRTELTSVRHFVALGTAGQGIFERPPVGERDRPLRCCGQLVCGRTVSVPVPIQSM
jgi:fatty-acyl-CoA synthase